MKRIVRPHSTVRSAAPNVSQASAAMLIGLARRSSRGHVPGHGMVTAESDTRIQPMTPTAATPATRFFGSDRWRPPCRSPSTGASRPISGEERGDDAHHAAALERPVRRVRAEPPIHGLAERIDEANAATAVAHHERSGQPLRQLGPGRDFDVPTTCRRPALRRAQARSASHGSHGQEDRRGDGRRFMERRFTGPARRDRNQEGGGAATQSESCRFLSRWMNQYPQPNGNASSAYDRERRRNGLQCSRRTSAGSSARALDRPRAAASPPPGAPARRRQHDVNRARLRRYTAPAMISSPAPLGDM